MLASNSTQQKYQAHLSEPVPLILYVGGLRLLRFYWFGSKLEGRVIFDAYDLKFKMIHMNNIL